MSTAGNASLPVAGARPRPPQVIPVQLSSSARAALRSGLRAVLAEGFDYKESMRIARAHFVDISLAQCGHSQKKACARMHVSREHIRRVLDTFREIAL
jgi:hypothetical protein